MTKSERPLPSFRWPPVMEVVLGVNFRRLQTLRSPELVDFWRSYLTDLPEAEEHPRYDPPVESLEPGQPNAGPSVRFGFGDAPTTPRLWFISYDRSQLVQVQPDWFATNWRQVESAPEYIRYPVVRNNFEQRLASFGEFLQARDLGGASFRQCEVTYVNHIEGMDVWEDHSQLYKVFNFFSPPLGEYYLTTNEATVVQTRYLIEDESGYPVGRLHLDIRPTYKKGAKEPIVALKFTVRGEPREDSLDGVLRFFDLARSSIVHTFVDITTEEMQEAWGRYE